MGTYAGRRKGGEGTAERISAVGENGRREGMRAGHGVSNDVPRPGGCAGRAALTTQPEGCVACVRDRPTHEEMIFLNDLINSMGLSKFPGTHVDKCCLSRAWRPYQRYHDRTCKENLDSASAPPGIYSRRQAVSLLHFNGVPTGTVRCGVVSALDLQLSETDVSGRPKYINADDNRDIFSGATFICVMLHFFPCCNFLHHHFG